jgi:hypothetical protein
VVFQLYDTDGDGYVTHDEALGIVRSIFKMIGSTVALQEDGGTPEEVWHSGWVPCPQYPALIVCSP